MRMRYKFWRHRAVFAANVSQEWTTVNWCELFGANLWCQHSYRIRIRRKYESGFTLFTEHCDREYRMMLLFIIYLSPSSISITALKLPIFQQALATCTRLVSNVVLFSSPSVTISSVTQSLTWIIKPKWEIQMGKTHFYLFLCPS